MSGSHGRAEAALARTLRRIGWAARDALPDRAVVRDVQGVRMTLPRSHRLPDYARIAPAYGQNLVRLAEILGTDEAPLTVLDVGANIGDSAMQILAATDARVLCVEADEYYLDYLHRNVDGDARVTLQESLLRADASDVPMTPVRRGGTTHFEPAASHLGAPPVTTDVLRALHPAFASLRLVKSDTDGYDVDLVPAIARTWASSTPLLFFEYDHKLCRHVGNDPLSVWSDLSDLGYLTVAAWDNLGDPVGRFSLADVPAAASVLDGPSSRGAHRYWDVAVAHAGDALGLDALERLMPTLG